MGKYNPLTTAPDEVRWFDPIGMCKGCQKNANGVLRGPRNESYGPYCRKCGDKRLKTARAEREAFAKISGAV